MKINTGVLVCVGLFGLSPLVNALEWPLPTQGDTVVGKPVFTKIQSGQDLSDIARHYDMGFQEVSGANPGINPEKLLLDSVVIVPTTFVLPNIKWEGIIVNVPEMRLFYFPKNQAVVYTFPIGIGKRDWRTPMGSYHVIQKMKDPYWQVPESIADYRARHGDPVPTRLMPPGPNNPLGKFALRLSDPTYLLHGTIEPKGVGREVSAGCMRMYPEDIEQLYQLVPVGTPVKIIDEPVKYGLQHGEWVIEAHPPLEETADTLWSSGLPAIQRAIVKQNHSTVPLNWDVFYRIVKEALGMPESLEN